MKRFLTLFAIWLGIAFFVAMLIDLVISSGLRKTDIRKYAVWNDIYKGSLHPDLIVIGSSRAWCGYNTYILDSMLSCDSYNLGIDGHGIEYQILRYDTYCRYNNPPQVVLINIDFLSTLGVSADSQYEREQFFPYIHDKELISSVSSTKRITWLDEHIPLVRYFGYREDFEEGVMAFFGKTQFLDGGMYKGYRGNEYEWEEGRVLPIDTLISASIDKEAAGLLDSFVQRLCNEGVKVVFVKSPVYQPLMEKFENIQESDSVFASISNRYGIPVLSYYYSNICFDKSYFYNPSHLNKKGSEYFTLSLCYDLDSLGVL